MATPVAPPGGFQNGGWYNGQQYWNGSFGAPGVIANPNQQGAGQAVSQEVNRQTSVAAGLAPNANQNYINQQTANPVNPVGVSPQTGVGQGSGAIPSGGTGSMGGGVSMPSAKPTFDLVAATEAAYNSPEILAGNKAISDAQATITARQQALATAQAGINDNPFYSEATRVGKSQQLTQQANNDMVILQKQVDDATGKVASLKADAAIKVNAASGQYNINRQEYQDQLTQFNNLLSAGALDHASGSDIANLAVQTGIPVSMIQSMQQSSIKKNNPSTLVQSTDDNGNLTLLAVDKNGTVVNKTVIAGAGKADKGSATTTSINQDKALAPTQAAQDAQHGVTFDDLLKIYQGLLDNQKIYEIYNAANFYKRPADISNDPARAKTLGISV